MASEAADGNNDARAMIVAGQPLPCLTQRVEKSRMRVAFVLVTRMTPSSLAPSSRTPSLPSTCHWIRWPLRRLSTSCEPPNSSVILSHMCVLFWFCIGFGQRRLRCWPRISTCPRPPGAAIWAIFYYRYLSYRAQHRSAIQVLPYNEHYMYYLR